MALLIPCLLFVLLQYCLLVRHVSVGAWYFTATPILCCLMPMLTTVVALPSELPVQYAKFHWCIIGLIVVTVLKLAISATFSMLMTGPPLLTWIQVLLPLALQL